MSDGWWVAAGLGAVLLATAIYFIAIMWQATFRG